jgi:hypothetical protein
MQVIKRRKKHWSDLTLPEISGSPSDQFRPWTPQEIATVAKGFIDHDLDGRPLYRWCRENGVQRTDGAIDAELRKLNFFDAPPQLSRYAYESTKRRRDQKAILDAKRNLALQVRLAKLEAEAGVPLFKPKKDKF